MKRSFFHSLLVLALVLLSSSFLSTAKAETSAHQFQVGGGLGVLFGTGPIDPSFDFAIEPEYFINRNLSASFRLDFTAGGLNSMGLGGRVRYYLTFTNHPAWSLSLGAGAGGVINFDGGDFGTITLPSVGIQYDFNEHIKFGSEIASEIFFGSRSAYGVRFMPAQIKWVF